MHDLRTPLHVIALATNVLERRSVADSNDTDAVRMFHTPSVEMCGSSKCWWQR
jgi:signal transduction histidine kinase